MRLAVFLTLPSAVGLWFLAGPIIGLIYEHGHFIAEDTKQTALALQYYAIGLVAYSGIKVLSPAFYAIDRKWTPMLVSFASVGLNLALNYTFMFHLDFGHRGLALSTTICATLNFIALYFLMMGPAKKLESGKFMGTILRCGAATVPMALICQAILTWMPQIFRSEGMILQAAIIAAGVTASVAVYLGCCVLLRVEETQSAMEIVLKKIGHRRAS